MVRPQVRWHFNKNRIATLIKNYPLGFLLLNLPVTLIIYILAGIWEIFIKKTPQLGIKRFSAILWVLDNLFSIFEKRSMIQKNNNRKGAEMTQKLLFKKTLFNSFRSFIKTR
jgi:hypothetical protein